METNVRSPQQLFHLSQHLNVPLFQRRYVWEQEQQWEPLWDDITRTALLREQGKEVTHFLGAVVIQAQTGRVGEVPQWALIDGQQRLTTLQLVIDAVAGVMEDVELDKQAARLQKLTHNDAVDVDSDDEIIKLRHLNDDGSIYREVISAPAPVEHSELSSPEARLVRAHAYFADQCRAWLGDADESRADALVDTLRWGLQLVAITLQPDEDSQEIFETLNARGTPLTSADLIKNLLFQRLELEGGRAQTAYEQHWRRFETPFWETEVRVGGYSMSRAALYLGQWLISRVGKDLGHRRIFGRFKQFVDHDFDGTTLELMQQLHRQAADYESWTQETEGDRLNLSQVALSVYRFGEIDVEAAKPLFIWLHDPRHEVSQRQRSIGMAALESWVMRRMLLRLQTTNLGRVTADLIAELNAVAPERPGDWIRDALARQDAPTTYWPGDQEVRNVLQEAAAYRTFRRGRLRMILEAVEDDHRGFTKSSASWSASRVQRGQMHIEHLLPQNWRPHWSVADLAAEIERDEHVHRLGNLTLLTRGLNSSVSNQAWAVKQKALTKHDDNLMTRAVRNDHAGRWDEQTIDWRTGMMVDALLRTWPVPEGHVGAMHSRRGDSVDSKPSLQDLVASGALQAGTVLVPRGGEGERAVITERGKVRLGAREFATPSGAGKESLGRGVNGWYYWRLEDGKRLAELRDDRPAASPVSGPLTPHPVLRRWIVEALEEHGGRASRREVLGMVERRHGSELTEADRSILDSINEQRWQNRLSWERTNMVEAGLMEPSDVSGVGVWALVSHDGHEDASDPEG